MVVAGWEGLVVPAVGGFEVVVVAAEGGEVVGVGGALWFRGVWWSRSQVVAGMRHPGNTQVVSRVSTMRRCWGVGRRFVVPVAMGIAVVGWVTVHRHSLRTWSWVTCLAMSAITGP